MLDILCALTFFTTPIGEKDLLEPAKRWPERREIVDSVRQRVLTFAGYVDSTGNVPDRVQMWRLDSCRSETDGVAIDWHLYFIRGIEGERDDAVWLVSSVDGELLTKSLFALLQTSCDETFLRGTGAIIDGAVTVLQLRHVFDCNEDVFLRTEHLDPMTVTIYGDGRIE